MEGSDMQSDISRLLKQRGHEVTSQGKDRDLLLPIGGDAQLLNAFKEILYNLMRRDSTQRALRDWAYGNPVSPNQVDNRDYIDSYIKLCDRFGKWDKVGPEANQKRYASTFEWYISEVLKREFAASASGFSLRLKDAHPGDEFDCVALLDRGMVFVECKTGRGEIYAEIAKFIRRDAELGATYSFFVFDRDYTFTKEGVDLPKLSPNRARDIGVQEIMKVSVGKHAFFNITGGPIGYRNQRWFLACPAFYGLEDRIRYMIRYTNELQETRMPSSVYHCEPIQFTANEETAVSSPEN